VLKVSIPNKCVREQRYILSIMLEDFLGISFCSEIHESDCILISIEGSDVTLSLDTSFFGLAHSSWLKSSTMPVLPLNWWDLNSDGIEISQIEGDVPILFGAAGIIKSTNSWHVNADLFGGAFFMLSRYEELVGTVLDEHNRFPASASIASKAGFLDRPIVNEYLEILWECIQGLWGEEVTFSRKVRKYRKLVSCDVDHPIDHAGYSLSRTIKRVAARLFRDRNPRLACNDFCNYLFKTIGSDKYDSYLNDIHWMVSVNKRVGNVVAFYFIPMQTNSVYEDANSIRSPKIQALIDSLHQSGQEIGIHPGYDTYNNEVEFTKSISQFTSVYDLSNEGDSGVGGRQHYLRYGVGVTPRLWEGNGLRYDSSLGYADSAGFRAGSCYEYTMYDLIARRPLKLKQRPLVAMDCAVISKGYEGLGFTSIAMRRFKQLEEICKKYQGDYTLLWHNSFFTDTRSKKFYMELINA